MHYVKLALWTVVTLFMAMAGFIAANVILFIISSIFTTNYEFFAPALDGEPRHLLGSLVCIVGTLLGAITPWIVSRKPQHAIGRAGLPRPILPHLKLVWMILLTPFMALGGILAACMVLAIPGMALHDKSEYFAPDVSLEPRHIIGCVVCTMGALLGTIIPWLLSLGSWKKLDPPHA